MKSRKNELLDFFEVRNWTKKMAQNTSPEVLRLKQMLIHLTNFLPEKAPYKQRAWHIQNDIYSIPLCEYCGEQFVKFHKSTGYSRFCSKKCSANSETSKTKLKQTNLKRYGVEYGIQSPEIRQKMEETNISKYGVKSTLSSKHVQGKIKNTIKKKYKVSTPFESAEVNEKRSASMIEKYGCVHALQSEEILKKMQTTMKEKYGSAYALQNDSLKRKASETNKHRYNRKYYKQAHISNKVLALLEDRDFLKKLHHEEKMSMIAMGECLGVSEGTIASRLDQLNITKMNHFVSQQELEFEKFFKEIGVNFLTNSRKIIAPFELDFYFPKQKIAIEFNGLYWHSEHQKPKNYHFEKYQHCKDKNIKLLQFFEDELEDKKEIIKQKMLYEFGLYENSVYARKCNIVDVDINKRKEFLNKHHIQGDARSSLAYGLEYDGELKAVISFLKKNKKEFILNRFATSSPVAGGFSRLLNHCEKINDNPQITTFADLRYSDGKLYNEIGFCVNKQLKPDYYWVKGRARYHKFNFRHGTGLKNLKNYDPYLSETENMHRHGFFKIYDAGKIRFVRKVT